MTCRVCGCTEEMACMTSEGPCHWVEVDLCSACVSEEDDDRLVEPYTEGEANAFLREYHHVDSGN